jgi:hypothetical protein
MFAFFAAGIGEARTASGDNIGINARQKASGKRGVCCANTGSNAAAIWGGPKGFDNATSGREVLDRSDVLLTNRLDQVAKIIDEAIATRLLQEFCHAGCS